ncbi:MAG: tRNA (N6-isopentenyl adenosine(37)-C2)-methylthiotransferase MiaB [Vulcanimicrobiaceae bacterium]
MAKIYIETFGCQMNEADSRYIAGRARSAGYEVVSQPETASVVVINTCTVRDNAERRAYGRMAHFKALKAADPSLRLVVCGCLAEQDRDRMQTIAPHVDAIFGTSELVRLGDALEGWRPQFPADLDTEALLLHGPLGGRADCIEDGFSHLRAFVTVQRGCSYYCSFCIVPYVRGRFDHRPLAEILAETKSALAAGAREIMLVGQTVNAYREPASGADFGDLCRAVAVLDGLERLTFISPHPKDFTEKIVRDLSAIPQLNPRLHLPLQSASDPILRRMNRKYTLAQYDEKVALVRRYLPEWAITTDLIVGFPGETEDDFRATLDYCAGAGFAQAFMFIYSQRRGTPAALWEQIPPAVAGARFSRLTAVQDAACRRYHDRKVGKVVRALVQGPSRKDPRKLAGKTPDNVTVIAPLVDGLGDPAQPWVDVHVDAAFTWGVVGTAVGVAARFDAPARPLAERPVIDLVATV